LDFDQSKQSSLILRLVFFLLIKFQSNLQADTGLRQDKFYIINMM